MTETGYVGHAAMTKIYDTEYSTHPKINIRLASEFYSLKSAP